MRISGFGHALFGASVAALAGLCLVYGNFAPIWEPLPVALPWSNIWEYGFGIILLAASLGLFFARTALASAPVIGLYGLAWVAQRARPVFLKPNSVGSWYGVCEAMAPLIGVWILFALLRRQQGAHAAMALTGARALRIARILFGAGCIVYGAAHFAYAAYTASMVPTWLPDRTALTYLTGTCHVAAGVGLLFGVLPYLAASLEGIMMCLFGVLVWIPSFFAHPVPDWALPAQVQWSETFLTFLMAASAFIVAASLRATPTNRSAR